MRTIVLGGLVAAALTCAAAAAPSGRTKGAGSHDGRWSIEVITERGDCDKAYRYAVSIENGQVRYAGAESFTVSGSVQPNGAVRGAISRGQDRADVVGSLDDGFGSGTWTATGGRGCGGRWNAERRG